MLTPLLGLLVLSGSPLQERSNQAEVQQVALLQSGKRVPCLVSTALGATQFETGFGVWLDFQDPVLAVRPARGKVDFLGAVKKADYSAWVVHTSERGLLAQLVRAAEEKQPAKQMEFLLANLENWGRLLDPVPMRQKRKQRVTWLWSQLQKSEAGHAALITGRLLVEISGPTASSSQRLGLADLRRGMRSKNASVRRAAGRLGAHQQELDLWRPLAKASLESQSQLDRMQAASSLQVLAPEMALNFWARGVLKGASTERLHAVENLANSNMPGAVEPLILAVAASRRAPGRFVFFGKQISLVTDFDVEIAQAAAIADPHVALLMEGIALQVRVVSSTLSRAACRALGQITGENPGPREEDWLQWWGDRTMPSG